MIKKEEILKKKSTKKKMPAIREGQETDFETSLAKRFVIWLAFLPITSPFQLN